MLLQKLTWTPKMEVCKMFFLFKRIFFNIFRFYVNFWGRECFKPPPKVKIKNMHVGTTYRMALGINSVCWADISIPCYILQKLVRGCTEILRVLTLNSWCLKKCKDPWRNYCPTACKLCRVYMLLLDTDRPWTIRQKSFILKGNTAPKINTEPENNLFEKENIFQTSILGVHVSFRGCIFEKLKTNHPCTGFAMNVPLNMTKTDGFPFFKVQWCSFQATWRGTCIRKPWCR